MSKHWEAIAKQTHAANQRLVDQVERLQAERAALLAGLQEARCDVSRLHAGLFVDLKLVLRDIDKALIKANTDREAMKATAKAFDKPLPKPATQ